MSRFNVNATPKNLTINRAGGIAYKQSDELALISLCSTSMLKRQTYRTEDQEVIQLLGMLEKVDPLYAAQCAVYVRQELGMRTISHLMAVLLAPYLRGKPYARSFYDKVVRRLDDITEILALQYAIGGKNSFPHAMTDGLARAMERFDKYSFAKYQMVGREISMVDAVRICRPSINQRNGEAIDLLMLGKLTSEGETWESKLSQAGRDAAAENAFSYEKEEMKIEAWISLLREGKVKYLACLRNLRNIILGGDRNPLNVEAAELSCNIIRNRDLANEAKIMPINFLTAISEIEKMQRSRLTDMVQNAINDVVEATCENMERYDGNTIVCVDQSGSMRNKHVCGTAGYFGAMLHKAWGSDIIVFGSSAQYVNPNPRIPLIELARTLAVADKRGTNFHSIFETMDKQYDRIVILSDMQGWMGPYTNTYGWPRGSTANTSANKYRNRMDCNPQIYSWDLVGYSDMQFPETQTFCMAGLSEKTLDMFSRLSSDKRALVKIVKEIKL